MCVASMVSDFYRDRWNQPQSLPYYTITTGSEVSRKDFEDLKKEVEDMKKLLQKAIEYDKINNQPHCEMEDKVELLKKVAELVGVSLEDIFEK